MGVFKDDDQSSSTFDRPDSKVLEDFVNKKDITHLIILDHDRDFSERSNFMIRAFKVMMAESELHNIRDKRKMVWCRPRYLADIPTYPPKCLTR